MTMKRILTAATIAAGLLVSSGADAKSQSDKTKMLSLRVCKN